MLDIDNMAAPSCARLGARQKCKPYGSVDLWVKVGAFERIWTKQSLARSDNFSGVIIFSQIPFFLLCQSLSYLSKKYIYMYTVSC